MTSAIVAKSRYDIQALVAARKALEAGAACVRVAFLSGHPGCVFTPSDLPAIRQKITYSM